MLASSSGHPSPSWDSRRPPQGASPTEIEDVSWTRRFAVHTFHPTLVWKDSRSTASERQHLPHATLPAPAILVRRPPVNFLWTMRQGDHRLLGLALQRAEDSEIGPDVAPMSRLVLLVAVIGVAVGGLWRLGVRADQAVSARLWVVGGVCCGSW